MMEQKTYNIFIGHSWAYNRDGSRLRALLNEYSLFKWKNVSSPPYDPFLDTASPKGKSALTALLESAIGKADCVLIVPGTNSNYLEWVQIEVSLAKKKARPVIVALPPGNTSVPEFMREAAKDIVGWSAASIVAAIRKWA